MSSIIHLLLGGLNLGATRNNQNNPPPSALATLAEGILGNQEAAEAAQPIIQRVTVGDPSASERDCKALLELCLDYSAPTPDRIASAQSLLLYPALKVVVERAQGDINKRLNLILELDLSNTTSVGFNLFCKLIEAGLIVDYSNFYSYMLATDYEPHQRQAFYFLLDHTEASQYCFSSHNEADCLQLCREEDIARLVKFGFNINARFSERNETVLLATARWHGNSRTDLDRSAFGTEEAFLRTFELRQSYHLERAKTYLANGANPHFKNSDDQKPSDLCGPGTEMHALLIANEADWSACEACTEEEEDEIDSSWKKLPEPERAELELLRLKYEEEQSQLSASKSKFLENPKNSPLKSRSNALV